MDLKKITYIMISIDKDEKIFDIEQLFESDQM
jgi:hypothetical protein